MMRFLLVKPSILFRVFCMLLLSSSLYGYNDGEMAEVDCTIKNYDSRTNINNESLKESIDLREVSTEGGVANVYSDQNGVFAIKSTVFGETGKVEIDYYFNITGYTDKYFVEMKRYRYSSPIYFSGSELASLSVHKFSVCNDLESGYPDNNELKKEYEISRKLLSEIKESIKTSKKLQESRVQGVSP